MTEGIVNVILAFIAIVPATLAAYWARTAKTNSEEAKNSSAEALHEVSSNGGMNDENPTLKDYIKHSTVLAEEHSQRLNIVESQLLEHLKHSSVMDTALAEIYLEYTKWKRKQEE